MVCRLLLDKGMDPPNQPPLSIPNTILNPKYGGWDKKNLVYRLSKLNTFDLSLVTFVMTTVFNLLLVQPFLFSPLFLSEC